MVEEAAEVVDLITLSIAHTFLTSSFLVLILPPAAPGIGGGGGGGGGGPGIVIVLRLERRYILRSSLPAIVCARSNV